MICECLYYILLLCHFCCKYHLLSLCSSNYYIAFLINYQLSLPKPLCFPLLCYRCCTNLPRTLPSAVLLQLEFQLELKIQTTRMVEPPPPSRHLGLYYKLKWVYITTIHSRGIGIWTSDCNRLFILYLPTYVLVKHLGLWSCFSGFHYPPCQSNLDRHRCFICSSSHACQFTALYSFSCSVVCLNSCYLFYLNINEFYILMLL